MERRTIAGTFCATILAGGVSAMIGATALGTASPFFNILIYGGLAAIVGGSLGLIGLWLSAPKSKTLEKTIGDQSVISHNQSGGITARNVGSSGNE
jgi:hypothetical protein